MRRTVFALALLAGAAFAEITVGPTVANAVKLGTAGIAAVNAGTAPVWTSAPPEPVLVHYWSFEGHQEDVVGDWDLTAQVGTTPTYPDGPFGKYIYEGTPGSVGRKEGPSGLPQPNAPWTLCFWYKRVPEFDTWWNVLWGNDADFNAYPGGGTVNDRSANRTTVYLWNVFVSDAFLFSMPFVHDDYTWTHFAIVNDGSGPSSGYKFYKNGVQITQGVWLLWNSFVTQPVTYTPQHFFHITQNNIDEVRLYSGALTAVQVETLFASYGYEPPPPQQITAYFVPGESCSADYYSAQYTINNTFGSLPTAYHYEPYYVFNYWRDEYWNVYDTGSTVPGSDIYLYAEYSYQEPPPSSYSIYPNGYPPSMDPWVISPATEYSSFLPTDFWWEGTYYVIWGWTSGNNGWIGNGSGYYVNGDDTVTPSYSTP